MGWDMSVGKKIWKEFHKKPRVWVYVSIYVEEQEKGAKSA